MRTNLITLLGLIVLGTAVLWPSDAVAVVYMEIIEVNTSFKPTKGPKNGLFRRGEVEVLESPAPQRLLSEIWAKTPEGKRRIKRGPRINQENETNRILFFKAPAVLNHARKDNTEIMIDVEAQRVFLLVHGAIALETQVSTARSGKSTPIGTFTMTERVRNGKISNLYDVLMPYWMRMNDMPYGVHAGYLPGYAASAGCIRLPMQAAELIYDLTQSGTKIHIFQSWTPGPPVPTSEIEAAVATAEEPETQEKPKKGFGLLKGKKRKREQASNQAANSAEETS